MVIYIVMAVAAGTLIYSYKYNRKKFSRKAFSISTFVFFVMFGAAITEMRQKPVCNAEDFSERNILAVVTQQTDEKPKSWKTQLTILDSTGNDQFDVLAYFAKDSLAPIPQMGDLIMLKTKIQRIKNNGNPLEFDFAGYMAHNGVYHQAYIKAQDYKIIESGFKKGLKYYSGQIRSQLIDIYRSFDFSEQELGVLEALTLGYKNDLDEDTKSAFQSSGAMHVLAVSGLHTGIIMLITEWLLKFLNRTRRQRIVKCLIVCTIIWAFAAITGFSSSVNRAALMFSLMSIGNATGRNTTTYNSLAVSGFILLIINPYLLFNVGFGLSYLAVLSIVSFNPLFQQIEFSVQNPVLKYFLGIVLVSIAAQIGTSVLSISTFGQFPVYFLLTNIIVIPVAYVIMMLAIALLAVSKIMWIGQAVFWLLQKSVALMVGSVSWIESLPGSCIRNIQINNTIAVLWYAAILTLVVFIYYKRFAWLKTAAYCILAISILHTFNRIYYSDRNLLVVYNCNKTSAVQVNNKLITNPIENYETVLRVASPLSHYANICDTEICRGDSLKYSDSFFCVDGKVVGLIGNRGLIEALQQSFKADILILSHNANCTAEELKQRFNPDLIVFDSSNSLSFKKKMKNSDTTLHYYDVAENGAFVMGNVKNLIKKHQN
ncbi:MAG: ComEC/Rec2 family competence protein [Bacteroidales bacterium]|nr:ComEC/Rec2 family competence protein [Bacteroidales bacterium]